MLVLRRKVGEGIKIGKYRIFVVDIDSRKRVVRLRIIVDTA